MPRKTKDQTENAELKTQKKLVETVSKKASTIGKKDAIKKETAKKAPAKKTATKKPTAKSNSKKSAVKTTKVKESKAIAVPEYYDLPYRYNETVVKVLAQTPTDLFIYWDISDEDRENFKKQYGENFFETTKPVLIVSNDTLHHQFEVEINDFANSWYLHVNDSKSDYRIELGRRPHADFHSISYDEEGNQGISKEPASYIYISSSNEIESPNDHILINEKQKMVYFRNVKTQEKSSKSMASFSFMRNMGKIYDIHDFYEKFHQKESEEDLSNPSSGSF